MRFSIVAVLPFFAAASASPMALHQIRDCDATRCALALGPAGVGCTAAAIEAGANPLADAACVAAALNGVTNPPASCAGCGGDALDKVEGAVGGAFNDVKNGVEGLF